MVTRALVKQIADKAFKNYDYDDATSLRVVALLVLFYQATPPNINKVINLVPIFIENIS